MSESQRKKITLILAAGLLSFPQLMGITAEQGEPPSVLCAEGVDCQPVAPSSVDTVFGSFPLWSMSEDEFLYYKIGFVAATVIVQLALVMMLVQILRQEESEQKMRRNSSAGTGTPSE